MPEEIYLMYCYYLDDSNGLTELFMQAVKKCSAQAVVKFQQMQSAYRSHNER